MSGYIPPLLQRIKMEAYQAETNSGRAAPGINIPRLRESDRHMHYKQNINLKL
jgi:hypothetical protein